VSLFHPLSHILGYVISAQVIHVDESKVKAISEWPVPTSIQQV